MEKETKRAVLTLEIEMDRDAIAEALEDFGGDVKGYIDGQLGLDCEVRKIIKIEEFGE